MPSDPTPLFRPELVHVRAQNAGITDLEPWQVARLTAWRDLVTPPGGDRLRESEHLADFMKDIFVDVLGYRRAVDSPSAYSYARERHNPVDGNFPDAVLGRFSSSEDRVVLVVEGKGPRDPLERPFAGRRHSAVEQAYGYAINLRCDWLIVTNMREIRLYSKRADQRSYETFSIERLANDSAARRRFVFLLGAPRTLDPNSCHLDELLDASEQQGREVTDEFYADYQSIRRALLARLTTDNALTRDQAIAHAQKLIDRSLFIAFCEDRGLLPENSLANAVTFTNPYDPQPKWENLKGLFRAVDQGSAPLNIPLYNGGLFRSDPTLDSLVVANDIAELLTQFGAYDFRSSQDRMVGDGSDVVGNGPAIDVDILGHIFEQSIEDLEQLRNGDDIGVPSGGRVRQGRNLSRRNREGAFYTPAFATRYMVRVALEPVLAARFDRLRKCEFANSRTRAEEAAEKGRRRTVDRSYEVLVDPNIFDAANLTATRRAILTNFWEAWLRELQTIRILDLACGSGAFLIEAFDQMLAHYATANDRLHEITGQPTLFDADTTILRHNLYGIDINGEAIEIAKLSIWIKTAQRGKQLTHLDSTIRRGNSVVEDRAVDGLAFDFADGFPEIFSEIPAEQKGFDVVVGNPPYVRDEEIGGYKPYFSQRYSTYHGGADLYVYFFERALALLKPGGMLAFVAPNKWLRTDYGEPLRTYLSQNVWCRQLLDFGHAREFFPNADVFPCIVVAQRPDAALVEPERLIACSIPRGQSRIADLSSLLDSEGFSIARSSLGSTPWRVEHPRTLALIEKIERAGSSLRDYVGGKPGYGVKTGFNGAFLIDQTAADLLIREDPRSAEIIKPYFTGTEIRRWCAPMPKGRMIFARRGIDINRFRAIEAYLTTFRERLEPKPADYNSPQKWPGRKSGNYAWYELQDAVDYWEDFERPKIVFQDIAWTSKFALDRSGSFLNNTAYYIPSDDLYLLGVLNSPVFWWYAWRSAQHGKDDALRFFGAFMETVPIPHPSDALRQSIEVDVGALVDIEAERQRIVRSLNESLRLQFDVSRPIPAEALASEDTFILATLADRRQARPLSAVAIDALKEEYGRISQHWFEMESRRPTLELRVATAVDQAYGLSPDETMELRRTAPPRTPTIDALSLDAELNDH